MSPSTARPHLPTIRETLRNENGYDALIEQCTRRVFPACDWLLIKAQAAQESGFDPEAKSPCGAIGLMQVMPATAWQAFRLKEDDLLDPEENLLAGITYLRMQYEHLPEIPDHEERLKFSLASYNAGRGYINKALELAYESETGAPMPAGHIGAVPGDWRKWAHSKEKLKSPLCSVRGRTPDWKQAIGYVEKIWAGYLKQTRPDAR